MELRALPRPVARNRYRQSIVEATCATLVIFVVLAAVKQVLVRRCDFFRDEALLSLRYLDWSYVSYVVVCPLQEFLFRGQLQPRLQRCFPNPQGKWIGLLLCSLIFGVAHLYLSVYIAIGSVLLGVIWGMLYDRHKTIVGVSLSHFLVGDLVGLLGLWDYFIQLGKGLA